MTTARSEPQSKRATRSFYGWRIVGFASLSLAMTVPGQTIGVSVFIDPMIDTLGLSRSQLSGAYLVGTILGGASLPTVGRLIDSWGVRRVMTVVGILFGGALVAMAGVGGLVSLAAGFTGIRLLGQGSLGLTSTTSVALWFERRRGFAMGLCSSLGIGAMSFAPIGLALLITTYGWRTAWVAAGVAVWVVVLPVARLGMRDSPAALGQEPDGDPPPDPDVPVVGREAWTRGEACRTLMLWAITATVAAPALIVTAVSFHQISLLGELGHTRAEAAALFVPMTVATLAATFLGGALADRISPRILAVGSMGLLTAGLLLARSATPGWPALAYAVAMGVSAGTARAAEQASLPRFFGIRHVGAIRGLVMAVSVAGTAVGPYLLAVGYEHLGGYGPALVPLMVIPPAVVVLVLLARVPELRRRRGPGSRASTARCSGSGSTGGPR